MSLEIKLGRIDKTYRPGDRVTGVVTLISQAPVAHNGLVLRAQGSVRPQGGSGGSGGSGFTSSGGPLRAVDLVDTTIEMAPAGKLPGGVQVPFEFVLEPLPGRSLAETYHGVYVAVRYTVGVTLARSGFMAKPIDAEIEFVTEVPSAEARPPAPLDFEIKPDSLENVKKASVSAIPKFILRGRLTRTACSLDTPFTGEVTVVESETRIKSIELQLVRVETINAGGGDKGREATEIQNLQIGDGDVCRNLPLPLYMIFPRVFTCPTVITDSFRVEFEVNVIVAFEDAYSVTENFPIVLYR